ncbi:hypothetical protein AR457_03285 [Streptomyces agglomeratus]|uniref:Uncharacterized protein n=1 Tax=Streptomyces agglomeratus TaxID=285458 RepID=A0A1E5P2C6_9ACTN|nr:hypothetical protein [Streptomyces agglomeratus]OEJ23662.1 hypothetical protein AS594_03390 [Streptomyces agglomeratus]OEJ43254.1 hypothetical protein AR457_03285 [Streptomyces agglomeratus]OEJ54826.1 hypothetical protein BGK72_32485 [Streptomyces agglomeratus]OEJ62198.1 hypothetical protein BGM19_33395 [Streptomyces agglomeratus]
MITEHCATRNHIDLWNRRVLPDGSVPLSFGTVLRGSLPPIGVWLGVAAFLCFALHPLAAVLEGGLFLAFLVLGYVRRRRSEHSMRCSWYGAVGGVLDKSMAGF